MFSELKNINHRPGVFSTYTADVLWTQPHLADQMLQTHLNQDTPLASRPLTAVGRVVSWLDDKFEISGKAICDLGCGPGLYTERFAQRGATVNGLDFSRNSIDHAKDSAFENSVKVEYAVANYLLDPLPADQDLITMIYCDLCPLSPDQRQVVLKKVRESLKPSGNFVFDVASLKAFENVAEQTSFGHNYMNGFWSGAEYYAFHNTFRYEDANVSLDHFTVVEGKGVWDVYNWMQYFDQEAIEGELARCGLEIVEIVDGFGVDETDQSTFGVIAKPK